MGQIVSKAKIGNVRLTPEYVVDEIIFELEEAFGKELLTALEQCFDSIFAISFKDNSVFDHPDMFAEALLYAFGEGREPMLKIINERIGKLVSVEGLDEIVKSGAYGYVLLINLIKRVIDSPDTC
jgi:hypothetical protein